MARSSDYTTIGKPRFSNESPLPTKVDAVLNAGFGTATPPNVRDDNQPSSLGAILRPENVVWLWDRVLRHRYAIATAHVGTNRRFAAKPTSRRRQDRRRYRSNSTARGNRMLFSR